MSIKSFKDFINEDLEQVRDKKVKHLEDTDHKDGSNKELEKETEEYLDKIAEDCPRCGENIEDCLCEEDDAWSTQNYHRVPKGTEHKAKPKQEFKK
jgi:formamidopyrimidine-DNA glycosylase|tara:strand:- start:1404 stop:1691 length:288 start_codon:yes stop_codon:yes gene_type:complete